jgi:hypothetical protein
MSRSSIPSSSPSTYERELDLKAQLDYDFRASDIVVSLSNNGTAGLIADILLHLMATIFEDDTTTPSQKYMGVDFDVGYGLCPRLGIVGVGDTDEGALSPSISTGPQPGLEHGHGYHVPLLHAETF